MYVMCGALYQGYCIVILCLQILETKTVFQIVLHTGVAECIKMVWQL